jgi:hypothetical protein
MVYSQAKLLLIILRFFLFYTHYPKIVISQKFLMAVIRKNSLKVLINPKITCQYATAEKMPSVRTSTKTEING